MWLCISVYSSPSSHIHTFLEGLENSVSKACIKYGKYIIMEDYKIIDSFVEITSPVSNDASPVIFVFHIYFGLIWLLQ